MGTIPQLCRAVSSQLRHVSTIGKKLVEQQCLPHMSAQYGELRPTNGWDPFTSLGNPANFNGFYVLPSFLQRCRSPEANQTLHDVWPSPVLVHYIYIFLGLLPPDGILPVLPVQNSLYVHVLRSPILAALLHGTPVVGVSQTLRRGTRNRITELSPRAPPIFGLAAITLGIGPHSSRS